MYSILTFIIFNAVIDLMNNTKWKGTLIKVQLAKESFLDKLKRERAGGESAGVVDQNSTPKDLQSTTIRKFTVPRKSDNFDFEIVSNSATKTRTTFPGDGESNEEDDNEDDFHEEAGIPKFKGLGAFGFDQPTQQKHQQSPSTKIEEKEKQPKISISEEDKARFERFQR
jgi:hypothetical protein